MADPSQERLDDLEETIDKARHQAEEDGLLTDETPEPTFVDPDADDDTDPEGMENAPG